MSLLECSCQHLVCSTVPQVHCTPEGKRAPATAHPAASAAACRAGFVAIIGRPNAGKSTLLNALVGQKLSIVTAKAQTTRHRILSILSEPGSQLILLDTPGIMTVRAWYSSRPLSLSPNP